MTPPSVGTVIVEIAVEDPAQLVEQLQLINAEAKRVERSARILKQQSARLIQSVAAHSTAKEAHEDGSDDT